MVGQDNDVDVPGCKDVCCYFRHCGCCKDISKGCSSLRKRNMDFTCKGCLKSCCSIENVKKKVPIVGWLPKYKLNFLQGDIIAGLTVALTVIPQGLALAQVAELPPSYGLYSAFMGCFVYCFLGTAKDITLGPTAIMSLMTAEFAGAPHHGDPTFAILLTFICGIIQLAMGILRLGFLVEFISYPVISSFTTAAAITIAFSQCKKWLGIEGVPREFMHGVYTLCEKLPTANPWDAVLGVIVIVVLYLMKRMKNINWRTEPPPSVPKAILIKTLWFLGTARNAFIVLVTAGIAAAMYHNDVGNITLTGNTTAGLPPFKPPDFSYNDGNTTMNAMDMLAYLGSGIGIVPMVSIIETIAIGKAFARKNNYRLDPGQEFIAIGIGNILGSFVSSYPVTGSFSRTAVNSQSGVRTPLGGVVTGGLVLLALGVLTKLFFYIPSAALACVIIMAVIDMIDFGMICRLWKVKKIDLIPWIITFVFSFVLGIEWGIIFGVGISMLFLLYPWARPAIKITKEETAPMLNSSEEILHRDISIMKLEQGVRFPGIEYLTTRVLDEALSETTPRSVVLDFTHVAGLDSSAVQGLRAMCADFNLRGVALVLSNIQPAVAEVIERAHIKALKKKKVPTATLR